MGIKWLLSLLPRPHLARDERKSPAKASSWRRGNSLIYPNTPSVMTPVVLTLLFPTA